MNNVQAPSSFNSSSPSPSNLSVPEKGQPQTNLPKSTNKFGIQISAEAQYLFEMDKYLSELDQAEQHKALEYLSRSDDVLHRKSAEYFIKSQESLDRLLGKDRTIGLDRTGSEDAKKLLDAEFEINGATEIAVKPMATKVFRIDGNESFYPIRLNDRNDESNDQLDSLEKKAHNVLGNQDVANLFGSVRNALDASENILLSFDDVLHFNYSIEKAKAAIDFIDAPESITSELTELLNHGVTYQNDKQDRFLENTKAFLNDSRVSQMAAEDIRMGTAAQQFNNQLQRSLNVMGIPVLEAQGTVMPLLTQHADLVRFSPDKLDEAFSFYKKDFENFEKALNKEFGEPVESVGREIDGALLKLGRSYAEKLIENISNHLIK